jgi:AcrR family transcriptional regulator
MQASLTDVLSYCILTNVSERIKARAGRMSSAERREVVLDAAIAEFAAYGLHGATTEAIAKRVGITQPYIFRLFGNKKELFLAAVERVYDRVLETWETALKRVREDATPEERMLAMGEAYVELMSRREELLLLLQAFGASKDPDVLRVSRRRMRQMYEYVQRAAGEADERVQQFFAQGMLLTVAAGLDLPAIAGEETWAREFMGSKEGGVGATVHEHRS